MRILPHVQVFVNTYLRQMATKGRKIVEKSSKDAEESGHERGKSSAISAREPVNGKPIPTV
jgi:hypothetical protein